VPDDQPAAIETRTMTGAGRDPALEAGVAAGYPHAVPDRLSYSDLSLFESCAKRYWGTRVVRVGSLRTLQDGRAQRFGTVVHAALELSLGGGRLGAEHYLKLCKAFELEASEAEEAATTVETFLSSQAAQELRRHDHIRPEWPFAIETGGPEHRFTLVGSIDAYGRSGERALIVDYKTGSSGDPEDLVERYRLQASVYALAAMRDGCSVVRVVFVRPQVVQADGRMQEMVFDFSSPEADTIEADLIARVMRISESDFPHLGEWAMMTCGDCPIAGGVCPIAAPTNTREKD
jgi:hypothetical protein